MSLFGYTYKKGHLIALIELFNPAMNIFGIIRIIMIRKYLNHLPVVNFTSLKLVKIDLALKPGLQLPDVI